MNDKGADQTAQMRRLICAFVVRNQEVGVSRVYAHMMLRPRLPGLRLATRLAADQGDWGTNTQPLCSNVDTFLRLVLFLKLHFLKGA